MTHPTHRFQPQPGRNHEEHLAHLASGYDTGWWDEQGRPAPWPEDFFDPDSCWQLTGSDPVTPEPGEPPF